MHLAIFNGRSVSDSVNYWGYEIAGVALLASLETACQPLEKPAGPRRDECCLLLLYIIRCYCTVLYCPESNHNGRGKKDRKCVWDLYHLTWPWHDLYSVRLLRPAAALLSLMRGSKFRNAIAKIF